MYVNHFLEYYVIRSPRTTPVKPMAALKQTDGRRRRRRRLEQDLHFFADNIWKLGMNLTAGKFLFLGDYVDRGQLGLECLAYLFSLKVGWSNNKKACTRRTDDVSSVDDLDL